MDVVERKVLLTAWNRIFYSKTPKMYFAEAPVNKYLRLCLKPYGKSQEVLKEAYFEITGYDPEKQLADLVKLDRIPHKVSEFKIRIIDEEE